MKTFWGVFWTVGALELAACFFFWPPFPDGPSIAPPVTASERARDPWQGEPAPVTPVQVTENVCETERTDPTSLSGMTRQRCTARVLTAAERDAWLRRGVPW